MKNIVLSALLLTALPTAASAGDLDFTYLQFGISQDHLTGGNSGSGGAVNGSLGLPLGFFLDGSLESASVGYSTTLTRTTAHAGWHVGVMDSLDLMFRLGSTNVSSDDDNLSRTGYDANVGLRAQLPAGFEMEADFGNAGASYTYFPGDQLFGPHVTAVQEREKYESAALRYRVANNVLLGISYRTGTSHDSFDGDTTLSTWLLTARITF